MTEPVRLLREGCMHATNIQTVKRWDRIARWVIMLGGGAIIACVLGILALIVKVTLPLFLPARATLINAFPVIPVITNALAPMAVGLDDYLETGFVLDPQGIISFLDIRQGRVTEAVPLRPPVPGAGVMKIVDHGDRQFSVLWSDGTLTVEAVQFQAFDDQGRRTVPVRHQMERRAVIPPMPHAPMPLCSVASVPPEGGITRVDLLPGGRLAGCRQEKTVDESGREQLVQRPFAIRDDLPGAIGLMTLDRAGQSLYAATTNNYLLHWTITGEGTWVLKDAVRTFADERTVTAMTLVFGDASLALGDSRGGLTIWSSVRTPGVAKGKKLRCIHAFGDGDQPVREVLPSARDKSLLSLDESGRARLANVTSERTLLTLSSPGIIRRAALSANAKGLIACDSQGQILVWEAHNPHPEISWQTLFGKVWYEGFDAPAYVWQSSSGSDEFEPKFSLVPLIFGTLKGALCALIFSVPLALFGAIYVSHFTSFEVRRVIKPTIEIMAAVPSVVLGFLAALWFAPLLERHLLSFFISLILIPGFLLLALFGWQIVRQMPFGKRIERGREFLVVAPIVILAFYASVWLAPIVERAFFHGNFKVWLCADAGVRYDLRNGLVIAFALGFAVIPIMFTLIEDALSNVPYTFTAASLALGASRWQTIWRVVLPSASPGIFAGVMIGLGRAIGETMIVLMATGNTPILDWSLFNGMRTLSANIAVEIPEAPVDGTLYRLLFLSGVMLFFMTFTVNTVAEVVRQRLRRQYGRY